MCLRKRYSVAPAKVLHAMPAQCHSSLFQMQFRKHGQLWKNGASEQPALIGLCRFEVRQFLFCPKTGKNVKSMLK